MPSFETDQRRRGGGGGRKAVAKASNMDVDSSSLSLEDCRCPVCLEIFMEPVTLPCTHTFCKDCFLESVDKATLCCPMCRKRVSTWARLNNRNNTLVDQRLWGRIQNQFPLQCQRRLGGQDAVTEDDSEVSVCFPRVSKPGEVRQEYQDQVSKLTEEKRVLEEEERRASEEYIHRLLAEEQQLLLQEETRRQEEDERLARRISQELNSSSVSVEDVDAVEATPAKKKKVIGGHMEKFLCPLPPKSSSSGCSSASSCMDNKENEVLPHRVQTISSTWTHGDGRLDPGTSSAKRSSPSSSSSSSSDSGVSCLQWMSEREAELLRRREQEEEDRRLALLLQKELDQQEKNDATNRRKGSADAYPLRQQHRPSKTSKTSKTTRPASSSSTSSASSPSPSGGSRQPTLKQMFSLSS